MAAWIDEEDKLPGGAESVTRGILTAAHLHPS